MINWVEFPDLNVFTLYMIFEILLKMAIPKWLFSRKIWKWYIGWIRKNPGIYPSHNFRGFHSKMTMWAQKWKFWNFSDFTLTIGYSHVSKWKMVFLSQFMFPNSKLCFQVNYYRNSWLIKQVFFPEDEVNLKILERGRTEGQVRTRTVLAGR